MMLMREELDMRKALHRELDALVAESVALLEKHLRPRYDEYARISKLLVELGLGVQSPHGMAYDLERFLPFVMEQGRKK